jgi:hypothetical protein
MKEAKTGIHGGDESGVHGGDSESLSMKSSKPGFTTKLVVGAGTVTSLQVVIGGCEVVVAVGPDGNGEAALVVETVSEVIEVGES